MTRLVVCVAVLGACSDPVSPPPVGAEIAGCDGAKLLAGPVDLAAPGPWVVGARTVTLGALTAEVWYPSPPSSDTGQARVRYDIRTALPATEAAKIPDTDNPWQDCACVRDLPLDTTHGPYPAIVFVHGTAGFRHQSLAITTHWASRGFIVMAVDHPGLVLRDLIGMACGEPAVAQNLDADIDAQLEALAAPTGELAFLAGHVDASRIALAGHSAGANAAASASGKPGVGVVIAMAGNRPAQAATLRGSVFLAGLDDTVVSPGQTRTAWSSSTSPRRFVSLTKGGHLAFSDLCETKNTDGQDLLAIANEHGVCGAQLAGFLFDCAEDRLDGQRGWDISNAASTAVLAETLQCQPSTPVNRLASDYSEVGEALEE
jgi:predicted esterase